MIRKLCKVRIANFSGGKAGLTDHEHPDLTNPIARKEMQTKSVQWGKSIFFEIFSHPYLYPKKSQKRVCPTSCLTSTFWTDLVRVWAKHKVSEWMCLNSPLTQSGCTIATMACRYTDSLDSSKDQLHVGWFLPVHFLSHSLAFLQWPISSLTRFYEQALIWEPTNRMAVRLDYLPNIKQVSVTKVGPFGCLYNKLWKLDDFEIFDTQSVIPKGFLNRIIFLASKFGNRTSTGL